METARTLLDEHSESNEGPQKRAESLRKRAANLLYKAQRHNEDINSESLTFISSLTFEKA